VVGVSAPASGTVVSVSDAVLPGALALGPPDPADPGWVNRLAEVVGLAGAAWDWSDRTVLRFVDSADSLPALEPLGEWVDPADPRVPEWLKPFNGGVLAVWGDDGAYIAGVGLKKHDPLVQEIAVGTEPAARGRGLARRLVVTAARAVLDGGASVMYLHHKDNAASAHVAAAAGFADDGWRMLGIVAAGSDDDPW
jgi:RimJ/RimL family protein N-acetyltransferase